MLAPQRDTLIEQFLQQQLQDYTRHPLAADASFRRYERILTPEGSRILMDAPPPKEEVRTFSNITHRLRGLELHAPEIIATDETNGFLLLEDLGGDSYSGYLRANTDDEWALYKAAIDVLVHLHKSSIQTDDLPVYHAQEYERELRIFTDWHLPTVGQEQHSDSFIALWQELLAATPPLQNCMVLRDYHADNLMWLPDHDGLQQVGLLDYQDAILGDPTYDLVSLLEDARRDVCAETVHKALTYYCQQMQIDEADFRQRYALLGAQRNCKIIGIFNRLSNRDGKPHYLDYLPRVWEHLQTDLQHPALATLKSWLETHQAL